MGVFAPVVGIIGATQAAEAMKLIARVGTSLAGRLLLLDALTMRWREVRIPARSALAPSARPADDFARVAVASTLRSALTTILAVLLVAHCVLLPGPPLAAVPDASPGGDGHAARRGVDRDQGRHLRAVGRAQGGDGAKR
jgi:hypothetical protein